MNVSEQITQTRLRGAWCRGRAALLALVAVPLALLGCGGTSTVNVTPTPTATSAVPTSTAFTSSSSASTATTSTTPQPGPAISLVWVVGIPGGALVRDATPGGGPAHTISALGADDHVIAHGSGKVVVATATHQFRVLVLASGSSSTVGSFSGVFLEAAAMSPDGTRLVYVDSADGLSGDLKVVDLSSGASTTLRHFATNRLDVPSTWGATAIGATDIVGASDAPPAGALSLDPMSGVRLAATTVANLAGIQLTADSLHAALVLHSPLGDEGDFEGGPGPPGPYNTLELASIGGSVGTLLREAHHEITVLATLPAGGRVLVHDGSAAGGFAGITQSPDFGLMAVTSAGVKTQYARETGTQYDGAAFYQDGVTVAAASHTSSSEKLVQYAPGVAPIVLDSVARGQFASVYFIAG